MVGLAGEQHLEAAPTSPGWAQPLPAVGRLPHAARLAAGPSQAWVHRHLPPVVESAGSLRSQMDKDSITDAHVKRGDRSRLHKAPNGPTLAPHEQ